MKMLFAGRRRALFTGFALPVMAAAPLLATAVVAQAQAPSQAQAQGQAGPGFPSRPIRWIVPYPAGGGSDFLARTIGQQLSARVHQPVVVDNKPGANTAIGAAEVARANADGYTVLSADNGTLVFNPVLYKSLIYNPDKDLAPVTLMGRFPMILVVTPSEPAKDAKAFIERIKARPDGLNYGSAGAGSPHHLAMELFRTETGLKMTHTPYRGAAPALTDVAGGQVGAMMVDLAAGAGFIQTGKVRPLAVANAKRLPQLPDVPTFAELGHRGIEAAALVALTVPAATPPAVIAELNRQVVDSIHAPDVHKKLVDFGIEPVGNSPAELADLLTSEKARWHKLIRELGITLE